MSTYSADTVLTSLQAQIAEVLSFAAALARRAGLGLTEMAALEHLQRAAARGTGLTPTQLGVRLSLSSGSVTALVDRLERAGYARRRPHPDDRRSLVVEITPPGLEHAARHLRPLAADLLAATAELSEPELVTVGRYLETVTAILARHAREGQPE